MVLRGKGIALPLLAVGGVAVAGYLLRDGRSRIEPARAKADVGARLVDRTEVPSSATVVDVSSRRLRELPGVRQAIDRAVSDDAREEWAHVTLDREGAWEVVDALRRSLPYHEGDGGESYNGVYVRNGDRIVLLDAIGWARVEEPPL